MTDEETGIDCRFTCLACPVQAEGVIDGEQFYFRARGNKWRMNIGGEVVLDPQWSYEEPYGDNTFDAGNMTQDEAWAFIKKAARIYRGNGKLTVKP